MLVMSRMGILLAILGTCTGRRDRQLLESGPKIHPRKTQPMTEDEGAKNVYPLATDHVVVVLYFVVDVIIIMVSSQISSSSSIRMQRWWRR